MVWFKVDDKMHSHPKARKAGVEAMGLWVLCGSWSSDQLTDGFIPDYIAASFAPRTFGKLAAALVKAGLWVPDSRNEDQGWTFHDWDERNPTRSIVETKRDEDRERKAEWREKKRAKAGQSMPDVPDVSQWDNPVRPNGTPASVTGVSQESPLYPDPTRPDPTRPDPNTQERELALVAPPEPKSARKTPYPAAWEPAANQITYADEHDIDVWAEAEKFRDRNLAEGRKYANWDRAFAGWLRLGHEKGWATPKQSAKTNLGCANPFEGW